MHTKMIEAPDVRQWIGNDSSDLIAILVDVTHWLRSEGLGVFVLDMTTQIHDVGVWVTLYYMPVVQRLQLQGENDDGNH